MVVWPVRDYQRLLCDYFIILRKTIVFFFLHCVWTLVLRTLSVRCFWGFWSPWRVLFGLLIKSFYWSNWNFLVPNYSCACPRSLRLVASCPLRSLKIVDLSIILNLSIALHHLKGSNIICSLWRWCSNSIKLELIYRWLLLQSLKYLIIIIITFWTVISRPILVEFRAPALLWCLSRWCFVGAWFKRNLSGIL